jgi:hypothetical protein
MLCVFIPNKKISPDIEMRSQKTQNTDMNFLAFFKVVASSQIYPHPEKGLQRYTSHLALPNLFAFF